MKILTALRAAERPLETTRQNPSLCAKSGSAGVLFAVFRRADVLREILPVVAFLTMKNIQFWQKPSIRRSAETISIRILRSVSFIFVLQIKMLSLQRSSNHQPWFTQQMANAGSSIPAQNYWLQMSVKNSTGSPPAETSSTSSSSCTASTTVPPPLASSSSSTGSQINSFYPSQDDGKRKQTRATLRTVNDYREPNLPLGKETFLSKVVLHTRPFSTPIKLQMCDIPCWSSYYSLHKGRKISQIKLES